MSGAAVAARTRADAVPDALTLGSVLVGVALRIWVLASPLGRVDSDEAVVGLMARAMPGDLSVFYDGQTYGGTVEPLLSAAPVRLIGGALGLKLVPILLAALAAVLTWRIARRVASPLAARVAGLTLWVFPPAYIFWSTKARGFYWAGLCLSLGAVLVMLRVADRAPEQEVEGRAADVRRDVALAGLLVGLGWWTTPQTLLLVAPVALWLVVRHTWVVRQLGWAISGFVLGALPWIAYNVKHGLTSLDEGDPGVALPYPERVEGFFTRILPQQLGLRTPYSGDWLGGWVGIVLSVAVVAMVVGYAIRRWRRFEPLLWAMAAYPLLFAVPESSFYVAEPRYGLWFMPLLAVVGAALVVDGVGRPGGATDPARLRRAGALLVVAVALSIVGIDRLIDHGEKMLGNHDLNPAGLSETLEVLDELDRDRVWADYWIAHRLEYESEGSVEAASVTGVVRRAESRAAVTDASPSTYVLFAGTGPAERLPDVLDEQGISNRVIAVDDVFVVVALDEMVSPWDVPSVW